MDRQTTKPAWNLTFWAVAGFALAALTVYLIGMDVSATVASAS